jgi:hypothetical protein
MTVDTFLTELYVIAHDFSKTELPPTAMLLQEQSCCCCCTCSVAICVCIVAHVVSTTPLLLN